MSERLPVRDFKWMTDEEIDSLDLLNYNEDTDFGCVLEVRFDAVTGVSI